MSGIYIQGMEMPKEQPLIIKITQDGTVYMSQGIYGIGHGVATAVPVPPHGRLIDADALAENHRGLAYELRGANYDFHMTACSWVNSAPTIIPAEEGE